MIPTNLNPLRTSPDKKKLRRKLIFSPFYLFSLKFILYFVPAKHHECVSLSSSNGYCSHIMRAFFMLNYIAIGCHFQQLLLFGVTLVMFSDGK